MTEVVRTIPTMCIIYMWHNK